MQPLRADILFGLVCCLGAISEETGCTPDGACASSGSSVLQKSMGRSIAQENELRRNLSMIEASEESRPPSVVDCDFEKGVCGWTVDAKRAWRVGFRTPSSRTGPQKGDHTANGKNFVYLEASSPNYPNKAFTLQGPAFGALSSPATFEFWYNMYGADMGTLVLEGYNDGNQALLSVAGETMAVYKDQGTGICLTKAGKDPRHSYRGGMGRMCQKLCDRSSTCGGYSVSRHNNCLLWNEPIDNLRGGGRPWGGAHCFVQGTTLTTTTTPSPWSKLWEMKGNKGDVWRQAKVSLPVGASRLRFIGTTGRSYTSDFALDDLSISAPPTTTTTPTQPPPTTVTTTTSDAVPVIPVVVNASEVDNVVLKVELVK